MTKKEMDIHENINFRASYGEDAREYMRELSRIIHALNNTRTWDIDKVYAKHHVQDMIKHFYLMIHRQYLNRNQYLMPEINFRNIMETKHGQIYR